MKKVIAIILALCLVLANVACAGSKTEKETTEEKKQLRFGYTYCTQNTFCTLLEESVREQCDVYGIELTSLCGNGEIEKQINDIESFITMGMDCILIHAGDSNALNPSIAAAKEAGIPIVNLNTRADTKDITVYVGSDDYDAGALQGEWLSEKTNGVANVGVLVGQPGHTASIGRAAGREATFFSKYDTITLLDEQTGSWTREEGMRITEDWLQKYPDMNVIVADNDDMALGAAQAVAAAGLSDAILICGVDAVDDAVTAIKDGTLDMSVFQDGASQAKKAVDVAYDIIVNGATYDADVMIPFIAVTIENADTFKE